MYEREILMIPGPVNFDPSVLRSLSKPTLSHVSQDFATIFKRVIEKLKSVVMTSEGLPIVVAGSGTLAMEMAVSNLTKAGDNVIVTDTGYFGHRFGEIFESYGCKVTYVKPGMGKAVRPEMVEDLLAKNSYKLLAVTHAETSTGVANPLKEICEIASKYGVITIVDGVCATGGMEERMDRWGIDAIVTASQKALGTPPGLAILVLSSRAIELAKRVDRYSYYMSLKRWLPIIRSFERGEPSYFATPPVNLIYALDRSLDLLLEEGLENVFIRHDKISKAFRAAIRAIGLNTVAEEGVAASTVTVIKYPEGIEDDKFRSMIRKRGVIVASGIGELKGRVFRVGHMGIVSVNDVILTISAIERSLLDLGYPVKIGDGVSKIISYV